MKLLYLTNGICGGGGLERVLCIKTRHFIDEQQHDVAIIRLNEQGQTPFFDFIHGFNSTILNSGQPISCLVMCCI